MTRSTSDWLLAAPVTATSAKADTPVFPYLVRLMRGEDLPAREAAGFFRAAWERTWSTRRVEHRAAQRRVLGNCWLWVANYHWEPRGIDPWSSWRMWQYTGDGKCDLRPRSAYPKSIANIAKAERNIFRGSDAAAVAFWQEHAWQPGGTESAGRKP